MIYVILIVVAFFVYCAILNKKNDKCDKLNIWFAPPGGGKTTFAAWLTKRALKKGIPVYSNVPITGAFKLVPDEHIGKVMLEKCVIIIDEAGLEYNNRNYKKFSDEATYFYKYHRHYQATVHIFSQGYDDMDKKLRTLARELFICSRSFLPWFVKRKAIGKRVGINELTKEIIDEYYFKPFSTKYIFCPPLWKTFNTLSHKKFPEIEWETW